MSNVTAPRIMAGVTAGYLLGRMHKLKLALIVGSALANRRLVADQVDKLTDAAGVGPLGEQLVSAGRKAAIGAADEDEYEDEESAEDEPEDEYEDEESGEEADEYEEEAPEDEYEDEEPAEDEEFEDDEEYEEAAR